jgi:hypothetical protein
VAATLVGHPKMSLGGRAPHPTTSRGGAWLPEKVTGAWRWPCATPDFFLKNKNKKIINFNYVFLK